MARPSASALLHLPFCADATQEPLAALARQQVPEAAVTQTLTPDPDPHSALALTLTLTPSINSNPKPNPNPPNLTLTLTLALSRWPRLRQCSPPAPRMLIG